jgi:hypothetical protein
MATIQIKAETSHMRPSSHSFRMTIVTPQAKSTAKKTIHTGRTNDAQTNGSPVTTCIPFATDTRQLKAQTAKWTDMAAVVAGILSKKANEI